MDHRAQEEVIQAYEVTPLEHTTQQGDQVDEYIDLIDSMKELVLHEANLERNTHTEDGNNDMNVEGNNKLQYARSISCGAIEEEPTEEEIEITQHLIDLAKEVASVTITSEDEASPPQPGHDEYPTFMDEMMGNEDDIAFPQIGKTFCMECNKLWEGDICIHHEEHKHEAWTTSHYTPPTTTSPTPSMEGMANDEAPMHPEPEDGRTRRKDGNIPNHNVGIKSQEETSNDSSTNSKPSSTLSDMRQRVIDE